MEDTPINDMDLDMIEAELNDTNGSSTAIDSTIKQANEADDTLSGDRFDRPEAIYLFGLDSMNTKDIETYCQNTPMKKVEWIDDSSCVLVFESVSDAQLAAQDLLQEAGANLNSTDLRNSKPFQRPDIAENDDPTLPPVRSVVDNLQIRMATDSDIKVRGARHRSRYYLIHGEPPKSTTSPNRTTADGKPLSILDRLGSRVPPLSSHHRRHDDQDRNSSRYDRRSRRRRSLSPTRHSSRPTNADYPQDRPTGAKMDTIATTPTDQDNDKSYEIPEDVRRRLGKLD